MVVLFQLNHSRCCDPSLTCGSCQGITESQQGLGWDCARIIKTQRIGICSWEIFVGNIKSTRSCIKNLSRIGVCSLLLEIFMCII